jgi:chemotaxis protein methyltransferase CheR
VRRQVCRRVRRRVGELGLSDLAAYRAYLETHPDEWEHLEALTPITISRFYRDAAVFGALEREVLPALAAGRSRLRAWSAGCASGEEPYTLALLWRHALAPRLGGVALDILGTDVDPTMLRRAADARYQPSSLKELPEPWLSAGFEHQGGDYVVRPEQRARVAFAPHDLRDPAPDGPFDLVLCRNVAFTYLATEGQQHVLRHIAAALRPGGALVLGLHESRPEPSSDFEPWPRARAVFRRRAGTGGVIHP